MAETIHVQVCYAKSNDVFLRDLAVHAGARVEDAIRQSGVLDTAPEIDLANCKVGVFGKLKALDAILREHDRVEIYRPLSVDPNLARQKRVAKKASGDKA